MGLLGSMTVKIDGDVSGLVSAGKQASGILSNLASGNFAGALSDGFSMIGEAAAGFAASSVSAAADFQQSMLKVQSYAGLTQKQADDMANSIMQMSGQVGQAPKELADAIYPIVSAGYQSSDALNVLKLSAESAAASGAQTSVVADALTTSLKSMHAPASQAGLYMDMLNKTVSLGKGELPQYAAVIGKLALSAGSANVPFKDMDAALATLTTHGFPSVAQASTSLGNLFTQIGPKVDQVKQRADKLGISFDENAFKSMSLGDKLNYLKQQTGGNEGEMLKLLGGNTLALKSFDALEGSVGDFKSNLNALGKSQGTTAQVFQKSSEGYNASSKRMAAAFDELKIKVGNELLPIITNLSDFIAKNVTKFADWESKTHTVENALHSVGDAIKNVSNFCVTVAKDIQNVTTFFQQNHDAAAALAIPLGLLGGVITYLAVTAIISLIAAIPGLVAGLGATAVAAWAAITPFLVAAAPFILIGVIVGAVVAGIIIAINHWGAISKWLQDRWNDAVNGIKSLFGGIGAFFNNVWKGIQNTFANVGGWFHDRFADAQKGVQNGWDNTKTFFKGVGDNIQNTWKTTTQNTVKSFQWLYDHNYYFKNLCDNITKFIAGLEKWLQDAWNNITNFASTQWGRLVGFASSLWNKLVLTIRVYVAAAVVWLQGQWNNAVNWISSKWSWLVGQASAIWNNIYNTVSNLVSQAVQFLQDKWGQLSDFARNAWQKVSDVFSNAWNTYIAGPLNNLWGQITGFWNNTVVGGAAALGSQLMNAIANGISGAAGAVGDAIHNAIGGGLAALGFHNIPGFASGVQNFGGGLALVGEKGPELITLPPGSNVYSNHDTQAMFKRSSALPSSPQANNATSNNNQPVNITIMLDGRTIGRGVAPHIVNDIRVQTGLRAA